MHNPTKHAELIDQMRAYAEEPWAHQDNWNDLMNEAAKVIESQDREEAARALRRYRLPEGHCSFCDKYRTDSMMPFHDASARCESGKRAHCTCDTCF